MREKEAGKVVVKVMSPVLGAGIVAILRKVPGLSIYETDGSVASLVSFGPDIVITEAIDRDFIAVVRENSDAMILPLVTGLLPDIMSEGFPEIIGLFDSEVSIVNKLRNLLRGRESDRGNKANDELSPREKEVVLGIVKGLSNKEIASEMKVSVNTVMTHRRNIVSKLQIHSPAGLTIYAITTGIVNIEDIKNSAFL